MRRRRPWAGLSLSIALHMAGIASLLIVGSSGATNRAAREDGQPLRIKIGNTIYLVTRLPAAAPAGAEGARGEAGRGKTAARAKTATTFRNFTPPPARRATAPDILYVPELSIEVAPANRLANVVVWTPALPKLPPRRMIMPGIRRASVPQVELLPAPDAPVTAEAARPHPKLPLPRISQAPPVEYVAPPAMSEAEVGPPGTDPIRVLAMSIRPAPPSDTVTLPRGNISPAAALGAGAIAGAPGRQPDSGSPSGAGEGQRGAGQASDLEKGVSGSNGSGDASSTSGSDGSGPGNGANASGAGNTTGSGNGNGSTTRSGSGSGNREGNGSGTAPASPAGSGNGNGRSGNGPGGGDAVNGVNGSVMPRAGDVSDPLLDARLTRIVQSPEGRYDAIVVQSAPAEAIKESRRLLMGSPVYTVYLSLGTRKDWILQYCVPRDRTATVAPSGVVIQINNPTPVTAPWPTLMLRGPVAARAGQAYVVVHGFVNDAGKMERFNIVRLGSDDTNEILMTALAGWQFRPAMQDGRPVTVEFLLAIPPDRL